LTDPEQCDFGDYELVEQLGQGGMGVVYRAWQRSLQREVALKLLSAGPWASPEFVVRFRREAQSAARMQHPNIVSIYEIGQHAELNFFSMALVRGRNLEQRLDETGPMPPRDAAQLVRTVAEALDYAHRLGILHLDLKPANVLVDEHGEPQVADFGLARRLDETLASDGTEVSGTPSYMAPEQAQAKNRRIGVVTDIYGLGAILYELLSGRPPFLGATPRQTLEQVVEQEVEPLHRRDRGIPEDLDAICRKCLAKDPDQRYVTARGLAEDLGRFLEGRAVSVRPLSQWQRMQRWARREPRVALAAAGAVLALLVGLAATSVQWRRAELQSQRAEAATVQVRDNLWQTRLDDSGRLLRDGQLTGALPGLLQNLEEQTAGSEHAAAQTTRVRIGSVLQEAPRPIDSIALGAAPLRLVLDPAGQWVAAGLQGGEVRLFDVADGAMRWSMKLDVRVAPLLMRAADGRHLIALHHARRGTGASLIDIASGEERKPPAPLFGLFGAEFAADGLYALAGDDAAASGNAHMRLVGTARWQPLGQRIARHPGMILLAPGGDHYAHYLRDPQNATITESPGSCPIDTVCVADAHDGRSRWQYRHARGAALQDWTFSPDGTQLALSFGNGEVVLIAVDGGAVRRLQPQRATASLHIEYSADGRWFGAGYADGAVQVWNGSDGELVVPPLQLGEEGSAHLELYPERRLLATYGPEDVDRLWHLPENGRAAVEVLQRPALARPVPAAAAAFAPAQNLIAAAAADGELRLWRYRERQPLPARAPPQNMADGERRIDAHYLLDVRGAELQRRRLSDGAPAGATLHLPQAAGFAQLLPDSPWVVASAGHWLHVLNAEDGSARYAPIELPATPSALLLHVDGHRALAAWQANDGDRYRLALRTVDLDRGVALADAELPGSTYRLQLAGAGNALLAWRYGDVNLLELDSLQARAAPVRFGADLAAFYQHNVSSDGFALLEHLRAFEQQVVTVSQASLGREGRVLWIATASVGDEGDRLHAIDAANGSELHSWGLPSWAGALQPYDDGRALAIVLPEQQQLRLYRLDGEMRIVKLSGIDAGTPAALALSADQSRLVIAQGRSVQWFDVQRGDWLSAPMSLPAGVRIAGLGMDAAGAQVLLRDDQGGRWHFALQADARPLSEVQAEIALLAPDESQAIESYMPPRDAAVRTALRSADPGPVAVAALDPSRQVTEESFDPDPRFVDLRPHCNLSQTEEKRLALSLPAPGRHRLLGRDFEVPCAIIVRHAWDGEPRVAAGSRVEGIAVGIDSVAAVDLLMLGANRLKGESRAPYATLEWQYADGSRARVPLRNRDQIQFSLNPHLAADASPLRIAWMDLSRVDPFGRLIAWTPTTYALRLDNPHPERRLRSLALESVPAPWSTPVLLAATIEPREDAAGAAQVHSGSASR
jgi:eukaryotic-like serine/threonine-protein kinase